MDDGWGMERGYNEAHAERLQRWARMYDEWEAAGFPGDVDVTDPPRQHCSGSGGVFIPQHLTRIQAAAARIAHLSQAAGDDMNIRVSYTQPGRTGRQTIKATVPDDARNIRCEVEIPAEPAIVDDFDVVRCVFPADPTRREYCYRDGGVKPGEWAIVHSPRTDRPETVRVVGYVRNDYTGAIFKIAAPVPGPSELRT